MRRIIRNALDTLSSPRSSIDKQANALQSLEGVLAQTLLNEDETSKLTRIESFVNLQDEFDSNISTRMLPWLITQVDNLKGSFEKSCSTADKEDGDLETIILNVTQSLSILQGVILLHHRSKEFMGRKLSLETILELLAVYRQVTHKPLSNSTNSPASRAPRNDAPYTSLASTVLDTLLCILVDSPTSLRLFEEANGVEIIVKLLKRASNPKDVRMKCLEFLYFYLMDETGSLSRVPTQPSSPVKQSTPVTRAPGSSRNTTTSAIAGSFPNSSNSSFSSFEACTPSFSAATSSTPPQSPTKPRPHTKPRDASVQVGPLGMLRKDVDFVPLSPKKAQIAGLGVGKRGGSPIPPLRLGTRQPLQRKPSPLSRDSSGETFFSSNDSTYGTAVADESAANATLSPDEESSDASLAIRTTEDKKRLLGQLLGNVDALVEGVKSAGIWGLGE